MIINETIKRQISAAFIEVNNELENAMKIFKTFPSRHHGWAVLREEVDELWDEIKKREWSYEKMRNEAKQVAAMAIRFMVDLTDKGKQKRGRLSEHHRRMHAPLGTSDQKTAEQPIKKADIVASIAINLTDIIKNLSREECQDIIRLCETRIEMLQPELHYCCHKSCPGYPYKATDRPHPCAFRDNQVEKLQLTEED